MCETCSTHRRVTEIYFENLKKRGYLGGLGVVVSTIECEGVDWIQLAQNGVKRPSIFLNWVMNP
jgi:hypothetical protein